MLYNALLEYILCAVAMYIVDRKYAECCHCVRRSFFLSQFVSVHRPLENSSVRTIYCNIMEKSSGNWGISQHKAVLILGANLTGEGGCVARLQPPQLKLKTIQSF